MQYFTISAGDDFFKSARLSASSFKRHNPQCQYTIFNLNGGSRTYEENGYTVIEDVIPSVLPIKEEYPYDNILYYKFCIAPFRIESTTGMFAFVDADTYCMRPINEDLFDKRAFNVAGDPHTLKRKTELKKYAISTYFNSGVVIYHKCMIPVLHGYKYWLINKYQQVKESLFFSDQTYLNIYLESTNTKRVDIGYWYNLRTLLPDLRCYIWHPGARGCKGMDMIIAYREGKLKLPQSDDYKNEEHSN
jgi:hypothetical protein